MSAIPPPFQPQAAPRPNNTLKIVLLVLAIVGIPCIGLIVFLIWLVPNAIKQGVPVADCALKLEDAREAIRLYAQDHEGKLPKAATWQDDVKKYIAKIPPRRSESKELNIGGLSTDGIWACKDSAGKETGIAFNSELAEMKIADIKDGTTTVLVFESPTAKLNAAEPYKVFRKEDAPKIFGQHRNWLYLPVEGQMSHDKADPDIRFSVDVGSNDSKKETSNK